ncbi:hypothetical protein SAMN04488055_1261 [Chitinophaga niabensis]|uniref:Uncharacterized protein n=1 Tax=Chitinophaga niabensis TaxID=536979 RepID=A0A1N6E2W9_9BACT|nr:hypothetical protein SAMN04488055_1261 [Chitinophaga niabensis]
MVVMKGFNDLCQFHKFLVYFGIDGISFPFFVSLSVTGGTFLTSNYQAIRPFIITCLKLTALLHFTRSVIEAYLR